MNAVITERLVLVAQAVRVAGHGEKQAIYAKACLDLGISQATLHRNLNKLTVKAATRKQRSDAGRSDLTYEEAQLISGVMMETLRANGKRLYSLPDCVTALRANGMIRAERIDKSTGELVPMSDSAISRALVGYGLHPDQLLAPAPCSEVRSLHPNHVWQIDASLCVLYYLTPRERGANGLHVMEHDQFYKNKPRNIARIMSNRVWSYEITDHTSGWIYVQYVMGAESGENLCSVLIEAMQERGGADLMHGRPSILYMDPGSANTSAMTRNLCKALGIQPIAHKAGNARATGQVEKARDIIERKFESGLRFRPVADLEELNELAAQWRGVFNAQAVHSRHGRTRSAVWLTITETQLIKVPSVEICRELAVAEPVERTVKPKLRIPFNGDEYDVRHVPGVMVGQKLLITRNPWRDDAAQIVLIDEEGFETFHVVPRVEKDEWGFAIDGPVYGENYAQLPETVAQKARKAIDQMMTGTETVSEAEAARKAKTIPLNGQFDPYKPVSDAALPTYMPRRGTDLDVPIPKVQSMLLNHVEAARRLRARLGDAWTGENYQWLVQRYSEGIPEDELDSIEAAMRRKTPTTLRAVGGE